MAQTIFRFKFIKATLIWSLLLGSIVTSCSNKEDTPPPPADKTALQASVTTAQALYDGTVEGTKPGQYVVGSKTAFGSVLDQAKAVLADPNATQTAVTNANAQLQAATTTYQSNKINEIAAANLIGFWKFNGNADDSSGNSNNGTLKTGAASYGAGIPVLTSDRFGRANMAYRFDHGGNIEVPYSTSLNPQEMSISLWCKKDIVGRTWATDAYYLVSLNRWRGYKLQFQSTNRAFLTVLTVRAAGDTGYVDHDGTLSLLNDQWYHVVATFKAGEMNFYIDGTLTHSWTGADAPGNPITLASPTNFTIGQDLPTDKYTDFDDGVENHFVNYGGFWTGDIDDVIFYNVALDGPQVASIFTNQNTL